MLVVVSLRHAIVLFHAPKTFIDAVERPDVQILRTATELTSLIEEINRDASYHELSILLEYQRDAESHASLDRNLTVAQVPEPDSLVEADSLRQIHLLGLLERLATIEQSIAPMIECAVHSQFNRRIVSEVPPQHLLVLANSVVLVGEIAERAPNRRHVLINILFALSPVSVDLVGRRVFVKTFCYRLVLFFCGL